MEFEKLSINELKKCIIDGRIVTSDGKERTFDLLDFYLMSSYRPDTFLNLVKKNSTVSENEKLVKFFIILRNKQPLVRKATVSELISIDYSYKGFKLNEDDKYHIVTFLTSRNIPINEATYFYAARKYFDGIIDLYENTDSEVMYRKKVK